MIMNRDCARSTAKRAEELFRPRGTQLKCAAYSEQHNDQRIAAMHVFRIMGCQVPAKAARSLALPSTLRGQAANGHDLSR